MCVYALNSVSLKSRVKLDSINVEMQGCYLCFMPICARKATDTLANIHYVLIHQNPNYLNAYTYLK